MLQHHSSVWLSRAMAGELCLPLEDKQDPGGGGRKAITTRVEPQAVGGLSTNAFSRPRLSCAL